MLSVFISPSIVSFLSPQEKTWYCCIVCVLLWWWNMDLWQYCDMDVMLCYVMWYSPVLVLLTMNGNVVSLWSLWCWHSPSQTWHSTRQDYGAKIQVTGTNKPLILGIEDTQSLISRGFVMCESVAESIVDKTDSFVHIVITSGQSLQKLPSTSFSKCLYCLCITRIL